MEKKVFIRLESGFKDGEWFRRTIGAPTPEVQQALEDMFIFYNAVCIEGIWDGSVLTIELVQGRPKFIQGKDMYAHDLVECYYEGGTPELINIKKYIENHV